MSKHAYTIKHNYLQHKFYIVRTTSIPIWGREYLPAPIQLKMLFLLIYQIISHFLHAISATTAYKSCCQNIIILKEQDGLNFLGTGKMGLNIGYHYKSKRTKSGCEHIFQSGERWRHSAPYNDPRNTSIWIKSHIIYKNYFEQ